MAKKAPLLVCPVGSGHIAPHRVCGEIKDVHVTARAETDRVGRMTAYLPGDHVPDGNALCLPVHNDQVEHFGARMEFDRPGLDLAGKGGICAKQQLLPCLAPGIKGAGDLGPAEGTVVEIACVVPRKGDPLGHALVDDVGAHLASR